MACRVLADESPIVPPLAVIEARAAEFRSYERQAIEAERAERIDLKAVERAVKKRERAKNPPGLPRPKEVLRRANA